MDWEPNDYGERPVHGDLPLPDPNSEYARLRDPPADPGGNIAELVDELLDAAATRARDGIKHADYLRERRIFANHLLWILHFGAPLEIQVEAWRLLWNGQPIYEPQSAGETFCQRLFADGVRWIAFKPGVDHRCAELLVDHLTPYAFFPTSPDAHLVRSAPLDRLRGVGFEVYTERRLGQVPLGASPVELATHSMLGFLTELPEAPELPQGSPELLHSMAEDPYPACLEEGTSIDLWGALLDDMLSGPDPVPGVVALGKVLRHIIAAQERVVDLDEWAAVVLRRMVDMLDMGQPENLLKLARELSDEGGEPLGEEAEAAVQGLFAHLAEPQQMHSLLVACSGIDNDSPVLPRFLGLLPAQGLATLLEVSAGTENAAWLQLRLLLVNDLRDRLGSGELDRCPVDEQIRMCRILGLSAGAAIAPFFAQRIPDNWQQDMLTAAPWILGLGATASPTAIPYLSFISGRGTGGAQALARADLLNIQKQHGGGA